MPLLVVDASAIAALLFGEPSALRVADRLEEARLAAPTLLRYELGSVCRTKIVLHPRRRTELLRGLSLLTRLQIEEVEVPPWEVLPVAEATGLSFYGASYLWLSRALGASLVTLDSRLEAAAAGIG